MGMNDKPEHKTEPCEHCGGTGVLGTAKCGWCWGKGMVIWEKFGGVDNGN